MLYLHFSPKQPSSRSQWLGGGLKCILICPSRTPIKNITTSYTRRHFGTWQIVLQNVIKKIMTHHSRTTIKNIKIFSTPRYFGIWQKVLKRIIKSINPSLKTPHKEYYNFIHTKIFWYLANSVTIYNYTYWSVPQDPPKKNITISHFVLGKWYYKLFLNMLTPSTLLGGNSFA